VLEDELLVERGKWDIRHAFTTKKGGQANVSYGF
jgi:hypothetical protein